MTVDLAAAMELGAAVYAFVAARADEDEARARAFPVPEWMICENSGEMDYTVAPVQTEMQGEAIADTWREDAAGWIARHNPARALREVAAVRAVLTAYEMSVRMLGVGLSQDKLMLLRAQAVIWEDHPDFDPAWRPGS